MAVVLYVTSSSQNLYRSSLDDVFNRKLYLTRFFIFFGSIPVSLIFEKKLLVRQRLFFAASAVSHVDIDILPLDGIKVITVHAHLQISFIHRESPVFENGSYILHFRV